MPEHLRHTHIHKRAARQQTPVDLEVAAVRRLGLAALLFAGLGTFTLVLRTVVPPIRGVPSSLTALHVVGIGLAVTVGLWVYKSPADRPVSADELRERLAAVPGAGEWTRDLAQRWWTDNVAVDPSQMTEQQKPTQTM